MEKISVIVPIYNSQKYLAQSIDSILNQSYKNIEIVLVNDGSNDDSPRICDSYAQKHSNIKVVHKKNGGVSSARNCGLDNATGEYIGFVDSDDLIAEDMYEFLYTNAKKHNTDISTVGIANKYKDENFNMYSQEIDQKLTNIQALEKTFTGNIMRISLCNKIFKRFLFDDIRFPLNMSYEDVYTVSDIFLKANAVYANNYPRYFYRQREGSITKSEFAPEYFDEIKAYKHNLKALKNEDEILTQLVQVRIWEIQRRIISLLSMNGEYKHTPKHKQYIKSLSKQIRKEIFKILSTKHMKFKTKLAYLFISLFPMTHAKIAGKRQDKHSQSWYNKA